MRGVVGAVGSRHHGAHSTYMDTVPWPHAVFGCVLSNEPLYLSLQASLAPCTDCNSYVGVGPLHVRTHAHRPQAVDRRAFDEYVQAVQSGAPLGTADVWQPSTAPRHARHMAGPDDDGSPVRSHCAHPCMHACMRTHARMCRPATIGVSPVHGANSG